MVGRKPCSLAVSPTRSAFSGSLLVLSREPHESGTTLKNSGGPESLTFLIRQLFSASVKITTTPGLSTDTANI